jgi:hypothetical protein
MERLLDGEKHQLNGADILKWSPRQIGTFYRTITSQLKNPIEDRLDDEKLEKRKQGIGSKQASHCRTNNNGKYATRL